MKRILTVLMSALMVLSMMPAMAFADNTADCDVGSECKHEAIIVGEAKETHYDSLQEAISAATPGDIIKLAKDIETNSVIEINESVTIDGNGHSINTTATRGMWINRNDLSVNLKDLKIIAGSKTERGVQINVGVTGIILNIDSCEISNPTHYGINVCNDAGVELTIKDSIISAWGALNLWSAEYSVNADNSVFIGNNDKTYDSEGWNRFGTIVLEGDTTGQTEDHAELNTLTFNNCVIEATTQTENAQRAFLFNSKSKDNKVYVNGSNSIISVPEKDDISCDNGIGNQLIINAGKYSKNPKEYVGDKLVYHQKGGYYFVGAMPSNTTGYNAWALQDGIYEETYVAPEPEDPITNTGSGDNASTNVDASDNTTTSDSGKTETTIDSTLGDKIVENAKENNVADVVIKAETEKGDSTGSTVALPESTVQALAKDTEASVTIKTDSAEVLLDKGAVDAVAAQAGTDGEVKLVVETVENTKDTLKVELKLVTSKGTVTDFQGGNVTVTVPVNADLAGKKLVCVYIDDNGKYIMMDGTLAADGKTFTFTTAHFSTYAILSEEEAKAAIDGQDISKASESGIANKTYTGKAVTQKLTVKAGDKALVEGTDYTVSYSKNVNVGVASVKITGKGKYEGTLTKTFKINPKGTSISKVTGQRKAVKVVWKKQLTKMKSSYVSGYQVQYSTSSKFTSGTSKYANAKFSKGRTTKTIKNLKSGKKYYVRVRTYKSVNGTKCYSSWSKAKSVKTK